MERRIPDGPIFNKRNSFRNPLIMAHRGGNIFAPQNSLPAFEACCRLGVWAVETDIRFTSDGVAVCHHDADISRMTDGEGAIASMTFSELRKYRIDVGIGADTLPADLLRIPTYDSYLDLCMTWGIVPFIEVKEDEGIDVIIDGLRKRSMERYAVISSAKMTHLRESRRLSPDVFIHHIFSSRERFDELYELGYAGLSFKIASPGDCPPELPGEVHEAGLRICLRAADTSADLRKMIELGLDYQPSNCVFGM